MHTHINVFSEISPLKQVLVHTPGEEIRYLDPKKTKQLLFSAPLNPDRAISEHQQFVKLLQTAKVEVVQLLDLVLTTFQSVNKTIQNQFINDWIRCSAFHLNKKDKANVWAYLSDLAQNNPALMLQKMVSGIFAFEVKSKIAKERLINPLPNMYYVRDPLSCLGNGVMISKMHSAVRQRETFFIDFIFQHHFAYKKVPIYYSNKQTSSLEGGDVFVINAKTIIVGMSQRSQKEAIDAFAYNLQKHQTSFVNLYVFDIPKQKNLMHLDTWITMVAANKFLYSPNLLHQLAIYHLDLKQKKIIWKPIKQDLATFLTYLVQQQVILIPVGGKNALQVEIDIETNFDAANFLTLQPNLVIGYDRNPKTIAALRENGVKIISWNGDQLSLGQGATRCMTMPLLRV